MSNIYDEYKGKWIIIINSKFSCTGKIEQINENMIILSFAKFDVDKLITSYVGIDTHLIEKVEFIVPPNDDIKTSEIESTTTPKILNVFTSGTQPPPIKRGGSSSAVNRNLTRQNSSQERLSKLKNSSFSDFGSRSRKNSFGNKSQEPSWLNYSPKDMATDFDFDKHLALFNKDGLLRNINKCPNEGSDSNDSTLKMNFNLNESFSNIQIKKSRSSTISFDPDDFSSIDEDHWKLGCKSKPTRSAWEPTSGKKDIFNELLQIGVIPQSCAGSINQKPSQFSQQNSPLRYFQQPDLVREITQQQLNNGLLCHPNRFSVISLNKKTTDFSEFTEYWNLDNDYIFPVFTVKQRDLLFEIASQLGFGSNIIEETVGDTLSEFVIKQVGGSSRINAANLNQIPKIAILLGKCNASVYATSVARYLLKKGCLLVVFIDENKTTAVNYKIDGEITRLNKLLSENITMLGYNFITHQIKDLVNKTFDFVISGVESDSCDNHPSVHLKTWCLNQKSQILCINPPGTSHLMWKSAVFIGVPTFSYNNLNIRIDSSINVVCCNSNRKVKIEKTTKKPDELVLLCNINFPGKVFSFLSLNYRSSFTTRKWVRLYSENDLCLVE